MLTVTIDQRISDLNLEMPLALLQRDGMSLLEAEVCIEAYRLFLQERLTTTSDQRLSPSPEADAAWHQHILCTQQYMQDCNRIFGHYLHHHPLPSNGCDDRCETNCEQCYG